jgi:hypothetical protein
MFEVLKTHRQPLSLTKAGNMEGIQTVVDGVLLVISLPVLCQYKLQCYNYLAYRTRNMGAKMLLIYQNKTVVYR